MVETREAYQPNSKQGISVNGNGNPIEPKTMPEIIGVSPGLQKVRSVIQAVAPTKGTVLLLGATGTGKELFANLVHFLSTRSEGPFAGVNCAAIPDGLIESELFGHEKGAFTGAHAAKRGKLEYANGGTIFLDEVGDLSLAAQAKVLRVLETRELQRVGGEQDVKIDVRVIAATNKNLLREVKEGRFREDLFYRLAVVVVRIPSLKERCEDIPLLAQHFLDVLPEELGLKKIPRRLSSAALGFLSSQEWRGNIRELQNVMRSTLSLNGAATLLEPYHFFPQFAVWGEDSEEVAAHAYWLELAKKVGLYEVRRKIEAAILDSVLAEADGKVGVAARILRIHLNTVYRMVKVKKV